MSAAIQRLTRERLPATALAYLDKLPATQIDALANQLVASMEAKDARVERALNRALEVVPLPLRSAVRKILYS